MTKNRSIRWKRLIIRNITEKIIIIRLLLVLANTKSTLNGLDHIILHPEGTEREREIGRERKREREGRIGRWIKMMSKKGGKGKRRKTEGNAQVTVIARFVYAG